ncbi:MAG: alginate export family protein [Sphingomonas sp.]|uniref:alginate export family protein n=1 Tax=Sphingomonas sp. TaxID=28214 RepID=UPI0025E9CC54|nr:alginate export family protein [Sphingomonas sp.]MBY0282902.1 alginate export family protein [Sphingomonas sp.]
MRRSLRIAALTLAVGVAAPAVAEDPPTLYKVLGSPENLKIAGSTRVRFEALDGQARPGFDNASELVSLRTTLFVEYDFNPIRIGGEIRDARVYDSGPRTPISTSEVNAVEPVQAYIAADLGGVLGKGSTTSLQAGRMIISLGSSRLVTSEEFRNTANGYTGLRFDYKARSGATATAFWVLPQTRLPSDRAGLAANRVELDRESIDLVLWGAYVVTPKLVAGGKIDVGYFRLAEHDSRTLQTLDRNLHTIDLRFYRDPAPGKLDWEAEGAFQYGRISSSLAANAPTRPVAATFYHLRIGHSFKGRWAPRLSIEYDYASGTRSTGSFGRFDTLFGGRRADFSPSGIYNEINRTNISSPGVRLEVTPTKRWDGMFEARALFVPEITDVFATTGVRDPLGRSGNYAGDQFDIRARYWLIPKVLRGEVDFTYLRKGPFLRQAPNAPRNGDTRFAAVSLIAYF